MTAQRRTPGVAPYESADSMINDALTARAVVDEEGMVTEWSEGARQLLGYPSAEIVGRSAARLLDEEAAVETLHRLPTLPRWTGSVGLRHRDGHRVGARLIAHHRLGRASGSDWLIVSAVTGTTPAPEDDKLATWAFQQAECCSMEVYDTRLRLRLANHFAQRALDLTEDDMRGLRHSEIVAHPEFDRVERCMHRVLATGEPERVDVQVKVAGETHKQAWTLVLNPICDERGDIRGVGLSAHDMTERYWAHQRLQLLNDASARIGTTLNVAQTAQELADVAVPGFADFATVDLLLDSQAPQETRLPDTGPIPSTAALRRIAHQSVLPGVPEAAVSLGEIDRYVANSPTVECLATGRAVLHGENELQAADWSMANPRRQEMIRVFGIHSVLAVPLRARGNTLGVAVFLRHQRPEPFGADDLLLAEEITARAAVAIDNARQYTRERDTAVALQQTLLPQRLPHQSAVEVACRYLPAGTLAQVGGDWFDVIPLSSARVALVVGDVVGHGVQASAIMGWLRTAVRTLADIDLPPDELLTHLDDLVLRLSAEAEADGPAAPAQAAEIAGGLGATCLYAVYDPLSRVCTVARAGHPAPVLVSPHGAVELMDVPAGPPLGVGGLPFEAAQVVLPEGSQLALYTDGLIESRDWDIDEGIARLCRALDHPDQSLDDVCDTVLATLSTSRPTDDVALLIARTQALDTQHVSTWDLPSDPVIVAQARKLVTTQLDAWDLEEASFVTELVVSELVTNAIRYAHPPIQLRLIHDRHLICEVSDASSTAPHLRRARTYDEGGRGLLLVAQLTRGWGARYTGHGKTIWAEVALDAAPTAL
ncbi:MULTISPECIES: SpoIIE family protein phosphatase [unclassified Streptomyces]|uniref:ATP-binding SpoIIE family protein phosphatase n=1 Tax=unclassified Streptomyces TaxID=2593676 RepID=UPI00324E39D2